MFVAKNRNGPDGIVYPLMIDWSKVKMQVLPESSETMMEIEEKSLSEHKKELYRKFKNKEN